MKLIPLARAAVLVCLGSLALAHIAAPVHAQNAQADAAVFAEFKKTCSAQITKMKTTLASMGEKMSDAEFDGFFQKLPAEVRDAAKFQERRADAAFYREMAAQVKADAAKPDNPDKGGVLMAPVVLCFLDIMISRVSGTPARPPSPAASTSTSTRTAPPAAGGTRPAANKPIGVSATGGDSVAAGAVDCVRVEKKGGPFTNVCDFPVYFTYCGVNHDKDAWGADCNQQKTFGLDGVAARGTQGGFTRAETIYIFACEKPKTPKEVEFIPGKGLYGYCK